MSKGYSMSGPARLAGLVATYGPAVVILCLPLEFTSIYLGQQLSRFVLAIVAVAFIYQVATGRRKLRVPRQPSAYLLLLFLLSALISWLFTRAPGSYSSALDLALYPPAALMVANLLETEHDHRRAWTALLVSGLAVSLLGAFLYATHAHIWTPNPAVANRLNITFGDPNITARFLTLCAFAAVIMYASRLASSWPAIACAAACAVILPLTFSRSGLALMILAPMIAVILALNHRRAAALAAVVLIAFALSTAVNPATRQRAEDAALVAVSAVHSPGASHVTAGGGVSHAPTPTVADDNRRYLISAGMKMAADHPVTGIGFGGYQHALLTTYRRFLPPAYTDSVSHTSLVTVIAEQGIVGTLLLLAFLIQLAREAWRARSRRDAWSAWSTVAAGSIIPIFLFSQFEGRFLQEPYLWVVLGMLYSALMRSRQEAQARLTSEGPRARAAAAA